MKFDPTEHKVIIDTLNHAEAIAFVAFLDSEIIRHNQDIEQAKELKAYIKKKVEV